MFLPVNCFKYPNQIISYTIFSMQIAWVLVYDSLVCLKFESSSECFVRFLVKMWGLCVIYFKSLVPSFIYCLVDEFWTSWRKWIWLSPIFVCHINIFVSDLWMLTGWEECICCLLFRRKSKDQNTKNLWSIWCKSLLFHWGFWKTSSNDLWSTCYTFVDVSFSLMTIAIFALSKSCHTAACFFTCIDILIFLQTS
jgi:hypothetical protein